MKRTAILAVLLATGVGAAHADLVCHFKAGNVTLDKHDFDELAQCVSPDCDHAITQAYFLTLKIGSPERLQICNSRELARKIKAGSVSGDDFRTTYWPWLPQLFGSDEQDALINAQINVATAGLFKNMSPSLAQRSCEPPRS